MKQITAEYAKQRQLSGAQPCDACGADTLHEFYGDHNEIRYARLVATNSAGTWLKVLCNDCWQKEALNPFTSVTRSGDTFTVTSAF